VRRQLIDNVVEPSPPTGWRLAYTFARKKDGKIRVCGDARALNSKTILESYPTTRVDDQLDRLAEADVGSQMDMFRTCLSTPTRARKRLSALETAYTDGSA
jgi:hypothetical protein